jgi:hypothetical protein
MLPMAQFFFRQQRERHNDQAATGIGSYGYKEDAQAVQS